MGADALIQEAHLDKSDYWCDESLNSLIGGLLSCSHKPG